MLFTLLKIPLFLVAILYTGERCQFYFKGHSKTVDNIRHTFLNVEGPNKWARGQTWGGATISILHDNPYPAKNVGGPGPPSPLGDYTPAL